jgi:pyruvate formate lyase activating enzyme
VKVCPNDAHKMVNGGHFFAREKCTGCGACEDSCPGRALKLYGTRLGIQEACKIVLEDRDFYRDGGGCTFSGGEPLLQAEFCREVFTKLKAEGIHCAVDTSGCVPWQRFETVIPYTDLFLYDVKHSDPIRHQAHTGLANDLILNNLKLLSQTGIPIEIRIPVIPGFNSDQETLEQIRDLLSDLPNIIGIKLLPFHAWARSKYEAIGWPDTIPHTGAPPPEIMNTITRQLQVDGLHLV